MVQGLRITWVDLRLTFRRLLISSGKVLIQGDFRHKGVVLRLYKGGTSWNASPQRWILTKTETYPMPVGQGLFERAGLFSFKLVPSQMRVQYSMLLRFIWGCFRDPTLHSLLTTSKVELPFLGCFSGT